MGFYLLMSIYGVAAVVLQATVFADVPAGAVRFDFILMGVAVLSFFEPWRRAVPLLILYGALADVASAMPFGVSILSYLAVYAAIRAVIAKISFQPGLGLLFWVGVMSLIDKAVVSLVLAAAGGSLALPRIILARAPFQALCDALTGFAAVPFLKWFKELSWEKMTRPKGLVLR